MAFSRCSQVYFISSTHIYKYWSSTLIVFPWIIREQIHTSTLTGNKPAIRFKNNAKCVRVPLQPGPTHDGSGGNHTLRTISERLPPNTVLPRALADFKRIPPFCGPLVEVKEPSDYDWSHLRVQCGYLTCWMEPLTCALRLFVANSVRRLLWNAFSLDYFRLDYIVILPINSNYYLL